MARKAKRWRRGTLYSERAELAVQTVEGKPENIGKERWVRETVKGYEGWKYYQQVVSPFVHALGIDPELTEEQKQVAVKEFLRRFKEGLPIFLASLMAECKSFAKTAVTEVPARSSKPAMWGHEYFRRLVV